MFSYTIYFFKDIINTQDQLGPFQMLLILAIFSFF